MALDHIPALYFLFFANMKSFLLFSGRNPSQRPLKGARCDHVVSVCGFF